MELKGIDRDRRPVPVKIKGSEFEILCDTVIPAIGQKRDLDFISDDLLAADTKEYKTGMADVYIGGDALRGASTAINAIGDGRKAAEQIIKQSGKEISTKVSGNDRKLTKKELIIKRSSRLFASKTKEPALGDRRNFRLVSETQGREIIIKEADRCLYCDEICNICTTVCPNFANYSYEISPVRYNLQKAVATENGRVEIIDDRVFELKQKHQILNIANFCNDCGNCSTFLPYKERTLQGKTQVPPYNFILQRS
ncbi:MAG: hypothetical protein MZV64_25745 [Ignavibacteriales bacterium]|nr:hypothetical protein [Ignavibacteriales bacterium]